VSERLEIGGIKKARRRDQMARREVGYVLAARRKGSGQLGVWILTVFGVVRQELGLWMRESYSERAWGVKMVT
jgi:hypothetical protein